MENKEREVKECGGRSEGAARMSVGGGIMVGGRERRQQTLVEDVGNKVLGWGGGRAKSKTPRALDCGRAAVSSGRVGVYHVAAGKARAPGGSTLSGLTRALCGLRHEDAVSVRHISRHDSKPSGAPPPARQPYRSLERHACRILPIRSVSAAAPGRRPATARHWRTGRCPVPGDLLPWLPLCLGRAPSMPWAARRPGGPTGVGRSQQCRSRVLASPFIFVFRFHFRPRFRLPFPSAPPPPHPICVSGPAGQASERHPADAARALYSPATDGGHPDSIPEKSPPRADLLLCYQNLTGMAERRPGRCAVIGAGSAGLAAVAELLDVGGG